MSTYEIYIDSKNGDDGGFGTIGDPWQTLHKANALVPGADFYHFHLVNNGWDYPYRATGGDAAALIPGYGGTAGPTDKFEWHCNNAVITGTARLTGVTWTRLPGLSYVYYCSPGWATARSALIGLDTGVTWIGEEAIWFQLLTNIPSDGHDHCWYWDSVTGLLYVCDHSGNPDDTGVKFEYSSCTDAAIYAAAKGNHQIYGARVFPGQIRCMYFNGPYNTFMRNKFFYGGSSCLVKLEGSTFKDNIFAYNLLYGVSKAYSGGLMILAGNGAAGLPNGIYNNSFYSGNRAIYLDANTGSTEAHVIKNNLVFDQSTAAFYVAAGAAMVEDYNLYGISGNEIASVTLGITSGAHSIPASSVTSTTFVGIAYPERTIAPAKNSNGMDKGATIAAVHGVSGFAGDIDGNVVPSGPAPDIGAYEIRSKGYSPISIEIEHR